ncbi:phosphoribosylformylglycinamidine synthase [Chryseobacterium piscium]|uniref:Phosphoribosylformylglycinamidine synthase n=1 Tax=Chryseobacterium piscium TaxID=333702 RepID=A0A3D9BNJ8_9FLAO|nr:HAEPLYID family protein [Chryseobacterium piscium]REC55099.1 phosphoribosylformylglycinamidine synthase [Chryseobacterium piscium]
MKTTKQILLAGILSILGAFSAFAQTKSNPVKVSHAEPIFQDLVRDLGARKGEKEFNLGADFSSGKNYRESGYLAEYEFAPINRLGLEVETDFSFFSQKNNSTKEQIPGNRLDGIRLSAQYTFFVSEKSQTSMALGYTQVIEFTDFKNYGKGKFITGLVYSPFFVAAKKWGSHIHTLVYTYPMIQHELGENQTPVDWQINTSVMYSLPNSGHFIGVEVNKEISHGKMSVTLRPQVKIKLDSHFAVGIVTGIPVSHDKENVSSFFRLVYEP